MYATAVSRPTLTRSVGLAIAMASAPVVNPAAILRYRGASPGGLSPMYTVFTGSYKPILNPPNKHCLWSPASCTYIQVSALDMHNESVRNTTAPGSSPFHKAYTPSSLATVPIVPMSPLGMASSSSISSKTALCLIAKQQCSLISWWTLGFGL